MNALGPIETLTGVALWLSAAERSLRDHARVCKAVIGGNPDYTSVRDADLMPVLNGMRRCADLLLENLDKTGGRQ